ncbi:hypothetical protein QFZ27_007479 [Inquilinus ginsengisoli]|uniref:hypothetical protein n=1 Tax=Inquilinus ginsengisoli TaxID=363840 RepID=UPI003D25A7B4
MTPLRSTRRHALGRRIGAAGLSKASATIAPRLATPTRTMLDDIDLVTDRIAPLPPLKNAGAAAILGPN